jgi:multiple sugar transport system permease protein
MSVQSARRTVTRAGGAVLPRRRRPARARALSVLRAVVIVLMVLFFVLPLVWMLIMSLKSSLAITSTDQMFTFTPTLKNYVTVFAEEDFARFALNSAIIAVVSTLLSLVIGVPAAYSIARYGMAKSSSVVLLARVVPGISLLVPWYFIFAQMGLMDTFGALILTHMFVGVPLVVWISTNSFHAVPLELEESCQIDGLSRIGAFAKMALPLAAPGLATSAILSIIFSWNNFLFSLVLAGANTKTLPVAVFNFISYASVDWGALMAASVVITLPVLIIAILMQRHVVSGLTGGATKG